MAGESPFARTNWTTEATALFGVPISEYDMAEAGFTVIREEGLLPAETIERLEPMAKMDRTIEIGRIGRKTKGLMGAIGSGIRARIREFCDLNEIGTDRLVSIKKDAVFVMGPPAKVLSTGGITTFRQKGGYTAFGHLGPVEIYCTPRTSQATLKGVRDGAAKLHAPFITTMVMDLLGTLEGRGGRKEAAALLQQFRVDYLAKKLPLGFYRELNTDSRFAVRQGEMVFLSDFVDDLDIASVEIGHNLKNVIVQLAGAVA